MKIYLFMMKNQKQQDIYYKSITKYLKLKKDENLINIANKNYDKKDEDKKIDKKKDENNKKKEDNKNKSYNNGNENEKNIIDINEIYKEIETKKNENNYIKENKDNKEEQIKNKENDSLDYNSNQIRKYIIFGLIFIIFSISLVLLGMFIQRRCFDNQRKKRLNELEEEMNDRNEK